MIKLTRTELTEVIERALKEVDVAQGLLLNFTQDPARKAKLRLRKALKYLIKI